MAGDVGQFTVKLAETEEERLGAQRLRYRVFVEEMGAQATDAERDARIEFDGFDQYFDHLILRNMSAHITDPLDRVVGVYRLMTGSRARAGRGHYGAHEYQLDRLADLGRETLELGRSCVAREYRGGAGIHLLWNGLAEYVVARDIGVMFGVASFPGIDPAPIAPALSHLYHNHLAPVDLRVPALGKNRLEMNLLPADQVDARIAMKQTPSLIKAYLRLGGFVGDGAYTDHDFNTIDVCVLMDTARMKAKYHDWYTRKVG